MKQYRLIGKYGKEYLSDLPGTLGGYRKLKIYGMLDCPSALRHIAKGNYVRYRVFSQMRKQLLQQVSEHVGYA